MTAEVNVPDEAYETGERAVTAYDHVTKSDAYDIASDVLRAAAPLIVAAELERLAKKFEGRARACKNFGFTQFSEGRADGLTVAKDELLRLVAELRGESR